MLKQRVKALRSRLWKGWPIVQDHLILKAKIRETEEAYHRARQLKKYELAKFWNNEVIYHLLVLSAALRDNKGDSGADGGESSGS
jgi:hypothetical protein